MHTKHVLAAHRIGHGGHIEYLGRILPPENRSRRRVDDAHPTIVQLHHIEVRIPLRLSYGNAEVRLVLYQVFDASLNIFNRAQWRCSGNYYKKFGNFVVQRSERANRVLPHQQFGGVVARKLAGPNKGHFHAEAFANCCEPFRWPSPAMAGSREAGGSFDLSPWILPGHRSTQSCRDGSSTRLLDSRLCRAMSRQRNLENGDALFKRDLWNSLGHDALQEICHFIYVHGVRITERPLNRCRLWHPGEMNINFSLQQVNSYRAISSDDVAASRRCPPKTVQMHLAQHAVLKTESDFREAFGGHFKTLRPSGNGSHVRTFPK